MNRKMSQVKKELLDHRDACLDPVTDLSPPDPAAAAAAHKPFAVYK